MADQGLAEDHCFDDDIVQLFFHEGNVQSSPLHGLQHRSQGSFMPVSHIFSAVVVDEFRVFLVDPIIGEMHEVPFEVVFVGMLVLFSCQPRQPLLIDVKPHGVGPAKQDIHPEIKFQPLH